MHHHLETQAFVDELVADLEPDDAVELADELTRMIELGLIELDATGDEPRVAIAVGLADPRERRDFLQSSAWTSGSSERGRSAAR